MTWTYNFDTLFQFHFLMKSILDHKSLNLIITSLIQSCIVWDKVRIMWVRDRNLDVVTYEWINTSLIRWVKCVKWKCFFYRKLAKHVNRAEKCLFFMLLCEYIWHPFLLLLQFLKSKPIWFHQTWSKHFDPCWKFWYNTHSGALFFV